MEDETDFAQQDFQMVLSKSNKKKLRQKAKANNYETRSKSGNIKHFL